MWKTIYDFERVGIIGLATIAFEKQIRDGLNIKDWKSFYQIKVEKQSFNFKTIIFLLKFSIFVYFFLVFNDTTSY